MPKLHIFNPSHDEALAAGSPYYYPARAARTLARDLATLPVLWAAPGDLVLLPDDLCLPSEEPLLPAAESIVFVHENGLSPTLWKTVDAIAPWGWDALLRHRLAASGAPAHLLPTDKALQELRHLSSRHTTTQLLPLLRQAVPDTVGESFWCTSAQEVWFHVKRHGEAMLKAPWSSSGRGVFRLSAGDATDTTGSRHRRVLRLLHEQGAVEVEPLYHRLADFATEFRIEPDGQAIYEGLSLFATTATGAYAGNIVADETELLALIPADIRPVLEAVRQALTEFLPNILNGSYTGKLGVDMMLVHDNCGALRLHPCVEVNLRHTMGAAAISLRRLLPAATSRAIFALRPVRAASTGGTYLTPGAQSIAACLTPVGNSTPLTALWPATGTRQA